MNATQQAVVALMQATGLPAALIEDAKAAYAVAEAGGTVTASPAAAVTVKDRGVVLFENKVPPTFDPAWHNLTINMFTRSRAAGGDPMSLQLYAASWANAPTTSVNEKELVRDRLGYIGKGIPAEFFDRPYSFLLSRYLYPGDEAYMTPAEIENERQKTIDPTRGE